MTDTDYAARSKLHAPRTAGEIAIAARELARDGHSDHTISQILGLDLEAVRQLIGERKS